MFLCCLYLHRIRPHGAVITAEFYNSALDSHASSASTQPSKYAIDKHSRRAPKVGDIVTFSWEASASRTRGIILRVREDIVWGDVSHSDPPLSASGGMCLFG